MTISISDSVYAADVVIAVTNAKKFVVVKDREGMKRALTGEGVLELLTSGRLVLVIKASQVEDMMPSQDLSPQPRGPFLPTKRECNRHTDCDAADAKEKARGVYFGAEHCHDDCCEDCFGN